MSADTSALQALQARERRLREALQALKPPQYFGVLPVRFDGEDLLDATGRVLIWDGDIGERTGRYIERLINGVAALVEETAPPTAKEDDHAALP